MMAHGLPCLYAPALGGPSNWIVLGLKEKQRQQSCDFTRVSTIKSPPKHIIWLKLRTFFNTQQGFNSSPF